MFPTSGSLSACVGVEQVSQTTMFERMAAIQEEITQICRRLESLRSTDETIADASLSPMVRKDIDPTVAHMLSVELCQLAASGDTVGVRILLNCGVDTDCTDYDNRTPLHLASSLGHVQVVRLLLEYGADIGLTDKDDKTPLNLAEENGCCEVVKLLLQHSEARHEVDDAKKMDNFVVDSPLMSVHPDFSQMPQPMMGSLIVIMVGLPGRGKSYIARQIQRYFQWNGLQSKIFKYAEYRQRNDAGCCESTGVYSEDIEYRVATVIAKDIISFIIQADSVAVLDDTNVTAARRLALLNAIKETDRIRPNRVVFVEVINNDPEVVRKNVNRVKGMFPDVSDSFVDEYYERIEREGAIYESLNPATDRGLTYIRVEGRTIFSLNNISGWMPSRLAYMLHNLSHTPCDLYLSRAGEYADLVAGRIGGNSRLTERGKAYSEALFEYFQRELRTDSFFVMSGCTLRCTETVHYFEKQDTLQQENNSQLGNDGPKLNCHVAYFPTLDDVSRGDCDGQMISDVLRTMPGTLHRLRADPYYTAWPNGECVHQVYNARLEPHIHDIQASAVPVLVVSHLQLLQGLHSYFVSNNDQFVAPQNAYEIDIPLESVIKIRLVCIDRVAEVIDLSKEVDKIQLRRTGEVTRAAQFGYSKLFRRPSKK